MDNGNTTEAVDELADDPRITVLRPGRNLGFARGCQLRGCARPSETLAVLNADAGLDPKALAMLVAVAAEPEVAIAGASCAWPVPREC